MGAQTIICLCPCLFIKRKEVSGLNETLMLKLILLSVLVLGGLILLINFIERPDRAEPLTVDTYILPTDQHTQPQEGAETPWGADGASAASEGQEPSQSGSEQQRGLVNVNTATREELMSLPGIGEVISERIIAERELLPFSSVEDLQRVDGIGEKKVEDLRYLVVV